MFDECLLCREMEESLFRLRRKYCYLVGVSVWGVRCLKGVLGVDLA